MYISYYDESGDDGYPRYSSPIFVLSVLYFHHLDWQSLYDSVIDFRRQLKIDHRFPVKLEMHSRFFLLNKNPFKHLGYAERERLEIFGKFCTFIGSLNLRIINTAIIKTSIHNQQYEVLDMALKLSIQRIENDLNLAKNPNNKFLVITDEGRVGKMRRTTRRMQKINYIPSKFSSRSYRREIVSLIEDPLPKNSKESYFIQLADVVAQVVYYHSLLSKSVGTLPNRLAKFVTAQTLRGWLVELEPSLNKAAAPADSYGIKYHPT